MRIRILAALLLSSTVSAATYEDTDRVAVKVARAVDGVIIDCPWRADANTHEVCVRAPYSPEYTRRFIDLKLDAELLGVWRAHGEPEVLTNRFTSPSGEVQAFIVPGDRSTRSIVALVSEASRPAVRMIPSFRRELRVTKPRMNGEDVRMLQNRLMDVSRVDKGAGGDGWYGPVTEANVIAFQTSNGLNPTGAVDKRTWELLFSERAKYFDKALVDAIIQRTQR